MVVDDEDEDDEDDEDEDDASIPTCTLGGTGCVAPLIGVIGWSL